MDDEKIVLELEAEAIALYHEKARDFPVEWVPDAQGRHFLGVSSLVKEPACDYARKVGRRELVEEEPSIYGNVGNVLADWHLRRITPHREIQVRAHLNDECDIVGHLDGATVRDCGIVCEEAKHQDPDAEEPGGKVDIAQRQDSCYAGMLQESIDAGQTEFPLASFAMPDAVPLRATRDVWGIRVHFCSRSEPQAHVKANRLSRAELAAAIGFYRRKAMCVWTTAKAMWDGMPEAEAMALPGGALSWQLGPDGLMEFRTFPSAREAGLDESVVLRNVLEHQLASRRIDSNEIVKRDRSARLVAMLAGKGLKSINVDLPDGTNLGKLTAAKSGSADTKHALFTPKLHSKSEWNEACIMSYIHPSENPAEKTNQSEEMGPIPFGAQHNPELVSADDVPPCLGAHGRFDGCLPACANGKPSAPEGVSKPCPSCDLPFDGKSAICGKCEKLQPMFEATAKAFADQAVDDGHRLSCPWPGYACTCGKASKPEAKVEP